MDLGGGVLDEDLLGILNPLDAIETVESIEPRVADGRLSFFSNIGAGL